MIIIDKTILTKDNIRSIAIEKDFPEPYEMLQDLGDIRNNEHVVYTSHLIFNST